MKKKILIIGNNAAGYALAKKMSTQHEVFITPSSDTLKKFATCLDIREDDLTNLLEFVMENGIDLTIPVSNVAINADIANIFEKNNQTIFSPTYNAAKIVNDKAYAKKIFYKLRIPTPKFGIFDKQNMVLDYIKNLKKPFVIKTNDYNSATVFTSYSVAKNIVESYYIEKNKRLIIEDYIYGTAFAFYTLTDGYKALPIGTSIIYKHKLEGDGGQLTAGMGSCVPNYKLTQDQEYFLMDNVIYPLLEYAQSEGSPYIGILGINGIVTDEGQIYILGTQSFMQDCDVAAILDNIDESLYELMLSCVLGTFSDETEFIRLFDKAFTSVAVYCKNKNNKENIINGIDNLEEETMVTFYPNIKQNKYLEYEASYGNTLILTSSAPTLSSATSKVYNEIKEIQFEGICFRKDICKLQNM